MCESVHPNHDIKENLLLEQSSKRDICMKCKQPNITVKLNQGSFCKNCFQVYVIHKFRAAIGRTKLIKNGEEVLIAFSGGANSAALLHLIHHGKSEKAHRKLRFIPSVLFVDEYVSSDLSPEERMIKRYEVLELLPDSGFSVYISSLEQALILKREEKVDDSVFSQATTLDMPLPLKAHTDELKIIINDLHSLTSIEDFLRHLRWQLIVAVARKLGIKKVLTAENCTRLAIQSLSSVVQGRGSQVSLSAGFADFRNNDVLIIRPLRDLSSTDLAVYNKLCDVKCVSMPAVSKITPALSIESLTETFVLNLQKDFPSTINNIKRTSEKLEHSDLKLPKCCFCQSPLDTQMGPSSALSALHFSQNWFYKILKNSDSNLQEVHHIACYGCCLTLKNFKSEAISFPVHIK